MRRAGRAAGIAALGAAALFAAGEWAAFRASRDCYPAGAGAGVGDAGTGGGADVAGTADPVDAADPAVAGRSGEAIIVLGYPGRGDGRAGRVQRHRVAVAIRSRAALAPRSILIFTGRSPHRGVAEPSEADVMAAYAMTWRWVRPDDIILEREAETTWANVRNTLPLLDGFDVVKIASDPFHSRRARRYLRRQSPEAFARLRPAADYRFGELGAAGLWLAFFHWAVDRVTDEGRVLDSRVLARADDTLDVA